MDKDAIELPPKDFQGFRELLFSRQMKLPKRLAQIAAYAMANPDEIALGTIAQIAEKAGVQPSALVRFSQTYGFQGFSDMQALFRDRIRERNSTYQDRLDAIRANSDGQSRSARLFKGFSEAAIKSIETVNEQLDFAELDKAIDLLARAETIYLLAQRRSYPITAYMHYAFGKLGIRTCLVASSSGVDSEILSFAGERDAAIAISFTPYASATLMHVRQAAQAGVPIVSLTDSFFSPLVADSTVWFEVAEANFQGFRSLSATMALAMTLTVAVGDARRELQTDEEPKAQG
ncbi:putative HTH-type transcriptional regulator YbbH [Hartmannibacter diazotrophicus]|uniref:Putative HTH-type transcriptional regulator YbbH n=2 Tax=Hartmannibacter diazotrophicus TaxID=1482074 RepID=A0A2C9DCY7_9HYPH|nr:putative HTH-type transcriptional regulator YbbH [Hartmannibacter diazotrophicus]